VSKLLVLSVVLGMVAIPLAASREASAWRGLKLALASGAAFNVAYYLAVRFILPRLY
jgi:hypothetical protein